MSDLTERLRLITVYSVRASKSVLGTKPIDTANASIQEAADALEAQEARIAVMISALESAKEELYFSVHSGSDPDDPKNMDGAAMAYRECRDALTQPVK